MNLPNKITFSRLGLAPVFIFVFFLGRLEPSWAFAGSCLSVVVAVLFEVTDFLDGFFARRFKLVTDLGKFLDPFADSVSRFTVFLCFLAAGWAELWMVAIIFYRDSVVANLRIAAASKGMNVAARTSGKVKALVQGAGIFLILGADIARGAGLGFAAVNFQVLCFATMIAVTAVTALSAVDYIAGGWGIFRSMKS